MKNEEKKKQLGMPIGTASAILKKNLLFSLVKKCGLQYCFQCGAEIESIEELSIEHKIPYLHSNDPKELFFNLDNIAFSHLLCNTKAARRRKQSTHGTTRRYKSGCKCELCTLANTNYIRKIRNRKKFLSYNG